MDKNLNLSYYTRIPNKNGFYTRIEFEKFEEIIDSTIKVPKKVTEDIKKILNPYWMIHHSFTTEEVYIEEIGTSTSHNNYLGFFYTDDEWFYVDIASRAFYKCDQYEGLIKLLEDIHLVENIDDEEILKKIEASKDQLISKIGGIIKKFKTFKEIDKFKKINNME